ncbi:hypothetical protein HYH03_018323 [Edaphochlamys debaryana]|uniref:Uncharacterized protein n=1 Tax=Edaphochlamys debaryana TaxID=47281 RepID=A0A836BN25_9CHLO|nr:hypothetical protein HYH03_018323 [Edaphochlamys debaryana]|eukprot:KAG2482786.1 hypothetical protein HYH03_018323 [Edaphochlamys debaryana]
MANDGPLIFQAITTIGSAFGAAFMLYMALKGDIAEFKADIKAGMTEFKADINKAEDRWLNVAQEGYSERRLVNYIRDQQLRILEPPSVNVGRE